MPFLTPLVCQSTQFLGFCVAEIPLAAATHTDLQNPLPSRQLTQKTLSIDA